MDSGPEPNRDDVELFTAAWESFFASVRRARGRAAGRSDDGLTLSQYQLLAALVEARSLPVGALASAAAVSGPTATRMLDSLARDGIVVREHGGADRRVVTVALTEHGRLVVERKHARMRAKLQAMFESLSEEERLRGAALLSRITDLIDQL